jgi:Cdc6-like AAA superfamily ATPase
MTPQIEGAIRTASVHVAIFSPRYAESSWCLKELVQMLESGSTIIPVFYNVEPSDLRWTRGGDRDYARTLSILLCMLTVLSQQLGEKVRVVGIVGLGGVGKTTVAKEFFNRHRSNYDRSCFVSDVRENVAKSALNSLQTTLLNDLVHLNEQINANKGIEKLKHHLSSSIPSLIVLDDVDHIDQSDALFLPVKDTIHSSSLILVTSRKNDVLTSSGISDSFIYKHTSLNRQHSQELF